MSPQRCPSLPPSQLGIELDPQTSSVPRSPGARRGRVYRGMRGVCPELWLGEAEGLSQPLVLAAAGLAFGGFWQRGLPRGVTFQAPVCFSWDTAALCILVSFSSVIF